MTPLVTGMMNVTLSVDTYDHVGPGAADYSQTGTTNYGGMSVANNVGSKRAVFSPALGISLVDSTKVSVSGANFDTLGVIPEPSSAMLLFSSSLMLVLRRRR